uniref:TPM domain-containing protein n=1 Tax=Caenorhabditis japonica TaxID=281687 RepID=A0A8R1DVR2_CAEJA
MITFYAIILSLAHLASAEEDYTIENYPNPKRGGFKECNLRSAGSVCDPYEASQQFADGLRRHWGNLDAQCGRFGILVLSLEDRRIFGSFDERSPIKSAQLDAIIATADEQVKTGDYTAAVTSILKEVAATMTPQPAGTTPSTVTTTKSSAGYCTLMTFAYLAVHFL